MASFRRAGPGLLLRSCVAGKTLGSEFAPAASQVRSYADQSSLLKTPLHDFHVELGGERPLMFKIDHNSTRSARNAKSKVVKES